MQLSDRSGGMCRIRRGGEGTSQLCGQLCPALSVVPRPPFLTLLWVGRPLLPQAPVPPCGRARVCPVRTPLVGRPAGPSPRGPRRPTDAPPPPRSPPRHHCLPRPALACLLSPRRAASLACAGQTAPYGARLSAGPPAPLGLALLSPRFSSCLYLSLFLFSLALCAVLRGSLGSGVDRSQAALSLTSFSLWVRMRVYNVWMFYDWQ